MKKFFYILSFMLLLLSSCSESSYFIDGTSSMPNTPTSNMAYIKEYNQSFNTSIDSCLVVHGHFQMSGPLDSIMCVGLSMGDGTLIPIILENGDINVNIASSSIQVEGTPLNKDLYTFLSSRDSLIFLISDLPRSEAYLFYRGYSPLQIQNMLFRKQAQYQNALDKLEDQFIKDNYKNVLGITWFCHLMNEVHDYYGYPVITPRLRALYRKAPHSFRHHPHIAPYFH